MSLKGPVVDMPIPQRGLCLVIVWSHAHQRVHQSLTHPPQMSRCSTAAPAPSLPVLGNCSTCCSRVTTSLRFPDLVFSARGGAARVTRRRAEDGLSGDVVDLDVGVLHGQEAGPLCVGRHWRLIHDGGRVRNEGAVRLHVANAAEKIQGAALARGTGGILVGILLPRVQTDSVIFQAGG